MINKSACIPDSVKKKEASCIQMDSGVDISTILAFKDWFYRMEQGVGQCLALYEVKRGWLR